MENNTERLIKVPEYYLFLDDYRFPPLVWWINLPKDGNWVTARHYYDFVHIISNNGMPKFISFDHDLDRQPLPIYTDGAPYKTGMDCIDWLINVCDNNNLQFPNCAVHSTNPVDGPKMVEKIRNYMETP